MDDVRVRKAINMAINKDRIVRIINGRATPASQVLPPLMPGYDKAYKGYPYDVEGAKKLMEEAGLKDGFTTTLYAMNTDPNPRIAQAIQQDLAAIGIKAEIKALAQPEVIAAGGNKDQAALTWSGGMGWIADFPDPSDFYGPILGCGGAIAGGWNWSWFCDKSFEDRATKADAMSKPEEKDERYKVWSQIFTDIQTQQAPWAPVFNERRVVAKSKRMGGADAGLHRSDARHRLRGHLHQEVTGSAPRPAWGRSDFAGARLPRFDERDVGVRRLPRANGSSGGASKTRHLRRTILCASPATTRSTARTIISPGAATSRRRSRCKPGETIHFECLDAGDGHFKRGSTAADVATLDFAASTRSAGPSTSRARDPATRSRSPSESSSPRVSGGRPTFPASACWPISFPIPRSTFGPTMLPPWRRRSMARKRRVPLKAFAGEVGLAPAEPGQHSVGAAARGRRQPGHPRSRGGNDALSAGGGRGRPLLDRRHACGAGRRRGVRHRHRKPDGR